MFLQTTPETISKAGEAVAENGRVLATLDDWRAIGFIFVVLVIIVLVVLFAVIISLMRASRHERADMNARLDRALTVADKFGDAADKLTAQLQVEQALNARVETALGRCEELLTQLDRGRGERT